MKHCRPSAEFIGSLCPNGEFLGVQMRSSTFAEDLVKTNEKFWREVDALSTSGSLIAVKFPPLGNETDS